MSSSIRPQAFHKAGGSGCTLLPEPEMLKQSSICIEFCRMSLDLTNLASQMPVKINKNLKKNDISHNYLFCSGFGR